jgi:hypothetical protein
MWLRSGISGGTKSALRTGWIMTLHPSQGHAEDKIGSGWDHIERADLMSDLFPDGTKSFPPATASNLS